MVGLDLGQRQDHSAIAVVCGAEEPEGGFDYQRWVQPMRTVWRAEELRRLPLGTMYTTVVEEVARVVRRPEMEGRCTVVADATGVGMPVMEMLRRSRMRAGLMPVILRVERSGALHGWRVACRAAGIADGFAGDAGRAARADTGDGGRRSHWWRSWRTWSWSGAAG